MQKGLTIAYLPWAPNWWPHFPYCSMGTHYQEDGKEAYFMEREYAFDWGKGDTHKVLLVKPTSMLYVDISYPPNLHQQNHLNPATIFMERKHEQICDVSCQMGNSPITLKIGGLSLGNVLHRNLSLMFKWLWRYFCEPDAFGEM